MRISSLITACALLAATAPQGAQAFRLGALAARQSARQSARAETGPAAWILILRLKYGFSAAALPSAVRDHRWRCADKALRAASAVG